MYDMKALYEAESVSHAIELLTAHPEARIIAGGSDEGRPPCRLRAGKHIRP